MQTQPLLSLILFRTDHATKHNVIPVNKYDCYNFLIFRCSKNSVFIIMSFFSDVEIIDRQTDKQAKINRKINSQSSFIQQRLHWAGVFWTQAPSCGYFQKFSLCATNRCCVHPLCTLSVAGCWLYVLIYVNTAPININMLIKKYIYCIHLSFLSFAYCSMSCKFIFVLIQFYVFMLSQRVKCQ